MPSDPPVRRPRERHIAIAWRGLRYLRFHPAAIHPHQRPWWNIRRWRFSFTLTTGGYWLIFCGPWTWARDLTRAKS